jgi:undecaprenyl diphosphate synthase
MKVPRQQGPESGSGTKPLVPTHVAIIMDGNGRYARQRHHPRVWGHHQGVKTVREIVRAATELGIGYLTLYAFSEENWKRPVDEVEAIFGLIDMYFARDKDELIRGNVRFQVMGDVERLPPKTRRAIQDMIAATRANTGLNLIVALSYGSRSEITRAARRIAEKACAGQIKPEQVDQETFAAEFYLPDVPDPDLLIRTSGEVRLSNFLLWQMAYTEMVFTPLMWPEFTREAFVQAIRDFASRDRRYGGVRSGGKPSDGLSQGANGFGTPL